MQLDDGRPIFQQVAHELSRRIARGALRPGDKLPTVREMALEFRVNPNTIQRACQELEGQGAVTSRRGHGIFVTDDAAVLERLRHEMVTEAVTACVQELRALGLDSFTMLKAFQAGLTQPVSAEQTQPGSAEQTQPGKAGLTQPGSAEQTQPGSAELTQSGSAEPAPSATARAAGADPDEGSEGT